MNLSLNNILPSQFREIFKPKSKETEMENVASTAVVKVTPSMAMMLLETNSANRKVAQNTVQRYARIMKDGDWSLNGESIKISKDNMLLDGQHRLIACVRSNASFTTLVTSGLDKDSFKTIDTGKTRSVADVLSINSEKDTLTLSASLKNAYIVEQNKRYIAGGSFYFSAIQAEEYLSNNPDIRHFVNECSKTAKLIPKSIMISAIYLMFKKTNDLELSMSFYKDVIKGGSIAKDSLELKLRNYLINNALSSKRLKPAELGNIILRVILLKLAGKNVSSIANLHYRKNPVVFTV